MEMEEEKHKFIIPVHERRQPGTVAVDPTPTQHTAPSPLEAARVQHLDNLYPQTAHLRNAPDASPPYPESRRISSEASDLPVAHTYSPAAPVAEAPPAAVVASASAASSDRQSGMAGWMRKLENAGQVEGEPRKTILGLTIFRFWAAVALGVIIVGVAIAVGLALGLANRYV